MNYRLTNSGFSLTEVLIAVGILAVGMVFVAGVFPVGIYLTTVATERTIASVAADEAFAKVRIYGVNLNFTLPPWPQPDPTIQCVDFNEVSSVALTPCEFEYPSVKTSEPNQYCWSALCRQTGPSEVQVTVFVSRKVNPNLKYYRSDPAGSGEVNWSAPDITDRPSPVKVGVLGIAGGRELTITNVNEKGFINDGFTIVDDATGRIYKVIERYKGPNDDKVLLDGVLDNPAPSNVWVVPPPVRGGRGPCIAVYQELINF
jgi:prepilin-type N-terminal cleavage/methylation domain-containing protein